MCKANVARAVAVAWMALAAVPAAAQQASLDKKLPFPKNGRVALGVKAGPLKFNEVVIRNAPNARDLAEAKSNPRDNCHPKLQVGVSNTGSAKMKFHVTVSLEDGKGTVYMRCERNDSISPAADNDHTNLCWLESMKTIDWPKLKVVHVSAEIDRG
jgi:hypothetical protein